MDPHRLKREEESNAILYRDYREKKRLHSRHRLTEADIGQQRRHAIQSTSSKTTNSLSNSESQHVERATSHLLKATADLGTALEFTNIPGLFAAESEHLRAFYRDLDALLAQLDALRLQFAEYVEAAEDDARAVPPDVTPHAFHRL